MRYRVLRQASFDSAAQRIFHAPAHPGLTGVEWVLERNPQQGRKASARVWIIKFLLAPVYFTIYYTIDDAKHIVHLIDLK